MAASNTAKVVLDKPGILRCGKYQREVVYTLNKKEAARLVAVKGFKYADEVKHGGTD